MTDIEIQVAKALGRCRYTPGSAPKRFARSMEAQAEHGPDKELSERQRAYLYGLCASYRRQISGAVGTLAEWLHAGKVATR